MKTSKMSQKQLAKHNEKVCKMVNEKNDIRIKENHRIRREMASLRKQLEESNKKFGLEKSKICAKEKVSEKFITRIIFGRLNEFEEEEEVDFVSKMKKPSLYA